MEAGLRMCGLLGDQCPDSPDFGGPIAKGGDRRKGRDATDARTTKLARASKLRAAKNRSKRYSHTTPSPSSSRMKTYAGWPRGTGTMP